MTDPIRAAEGPSADDAACPTREAPAYVPAPGGQLVDDEDVVQGDAPPPGPPPGPVQPHHDPGRDHLGYEPNADELPPAPGAGDMPPSGYPQHPGTGAYAALYPEHETSADDVASEPHTTDDTSGTMDR